MSAESPTATLYDARPVAKALAPTATLLLPFIPVGADMALKPIAVL